MNDTEASKTIMEVNETNETAENNKMNESIQVIKKILNADDYKRSGGLIKDYLESQEGKAIQGN